MSSRFSTADMHLLYCVETTSGTRPTTGYTEIPEVKSVPSFNPQPDSIETTTLAETEYRTYVKGLKSLDGALDFGANLTADLISTWETMVSAYGTGKAANPEKATWFCVMHAGLAKAVFFKGEPANLGLDQADVGNPLETTLYITPQSAPEWQTKPTVTT